MSCASPAPSVGTAVRRTPSIGGCPPDRRCRRGTVSTPPGCAPPTATAPARTSGRRWARGCGTGCRSTSTWRRCWRGSASSTRTAARCARTTPTRPHRFVWFHRDLRDEPEVTAPIHVVHRDERLVVVDKPPFLSSIPRGRHVMQSVVVRLRAELGLPDLSPLHRLDRVTSGLLMLATEPRWRGPYQTPVRAPRGGQDVLGAGAAARRPDAPGRRPQPPPQGARRRGRPRWCPDAPVNAETLVELESEVDGARRLPADAPHRPHPPAARAPATGSASRSSTTRSTPWCATSTSTTSAGRCSCSPASSRSPTPSTAARAGSAASAASR